MTSEPVLRDLKAGDLTWLQTWEGDPEVIELWPDLGQAIEGLRQGEGEDAEAGDRRDFIVEGSPGLTIGYAAFHQINWDRRTAVLDLVVGDKSWWDEGRCARIGEAILFLAFHELELANVTGRQSPLAPWLMRGLERCGFRRVGVFNQPYHTRGRVWQMARLSAGREQYMLAKRLHG